MKVSVRQGDNFWYYSQLFQMPIQLIIDSNAHIQPNNLLPGQMINIPGFVTQNYIIKRGDTLWSIAQRRNISEDVIFLLNQGVNPRELQIGQTITLPVRVTWNLLDRKREYDYGTLLNDINTLLQIYPFMKKTSIGESVLGNPIPELRLGNGPKRVHVNGSFHANEWITTPIIMNFINDYLLALTNGNPIRGLQMAPLYNQTMLSVVPMVNPDGVDLVLNGPPKKEPYRTRVVEINNGDLNFDNWKANIRGVDLNNQYPAKWELEKTRKPDRPAPRDYPGPEPLSEPESLAMAMLTRKRDFYRVLAFHTQGEVIYWGYENLEPPLAEAIVEEFARVSGYEPVQTVASWAGYKDWFIKEWQRPGYTVELGEGVNPLPLSQFDEIYQESLGIFLASLYM